MLAEIGSQHFGHAELICGNTAISNEHGLIGSHREGCTECFGSSLRTHREDGDRTAMLLFLTQRFLHGVFIIRINDVFHTVIRYFPVRNHDSFLGIERLLQQYIDIHMPNSSLDLGRREDIIDGSAI
ncbi:hypothetical protein D3C81_1513410 [compost metagenome]